MTKNILWVLIYPNNLKSHFMENKNPFQLMEQPLKDTPLDLKEIILNRVNLAKFMIELSTLYTSNFKSSLTSLLATKK